MDQISTAAKKEVSCRFEKRKCIDNQIPDKKHNLEKKIDNGTKTISNNSIHNSNDQNLYREKNVNLKTLKKTKIEAECATNNPTKNNDETAVGDFTLLQSTILTLQHQQVFQMQLIEQLQSKLAQSKLRKENSEIKNVDRADNVRRINHETVNKR